MFLLESLVLQDDWRPYKATRRFFYAAYMEYIWNLLMLCLRFVVSHFIDVLILHIAETFSAITPIIFGALSASDYITKDFLTYMDTWQSIAQFSDSTNGGYITRLVNSGCHAFWYNQKKNMTTTDMFLLTGGPIWY